MTDYNNKIRAVVLAALMVLSVFAGTVAFAGSASAASITSANATDSEITPSTVEGGTTNTHTVTLVADGINTSGNGNQVFSVKLPSGIDISSTQVSNAQVNSGNVTVGSTNQNSATNQINVTLQDDSGVNSETVNVTFDITNIDTPDVSSTSTFQAQFGVDANADGDLADGDDAGYTNFQALTLTAGRTVSNQGTVYLGETGVDLTSLNNAPSSGQINFVGISGDAEGSTASTDVQDASITDSNNFQAGGYSVGSDDGTAELFVVEPRVTGLTLYQGPITDDVDITDGSISSQTADNELVNVEPEFNFDDAENVTITVEDEDGLEITNAVVEGDDTAASEGNISLDFAGEDTGTYTITVEGESDLDSASRSATLTIRDETTTISLDETSVTKGNSAVATVTGEPGDTRIIQIDRSDLDDSSTSANDVFAQTSDVTRDNSSAEFVAASLNLGDDGEIQTRIRTGVLDSGTIDIEVVESGGVIGDDAEETAELTVEDRTINVTSTPSVVRIGEDFEIEGESAESDRIAAYARIDDDYELLAGDENPVDVDSDGSFSLEVEATRPINLADNYRIVLVNEEAEGVSSNAANNQFPGEGNTDQLSSEEFGELDTTATFSLRTVEGDLTASASSASIAADVNDEITISGTALGQGDNVRIYQVGPRGDVDYRDPDVDEEQYDEDFANFDTRGTYTFIVIGQGRDGNYAVPNNPNNIDGALSGDESPQQAVDIIEDQYTGAGVDDQLVTLTVRAENPQITIDDFTTDGQVAQEEVTISGTSNREDGTTVFLEVLGSNENVVASTEAEVNGTTGEWSVAIDMSDVETGTYTVRADDDESSAELEFEVVSSVSTPTEEPDTATEEPDTPTEEPDTATEEPDTETEMDTDTPTETSTSTPGFGVIVALLAFMAAALLAFRRN